MESSKYIKVFLRIAIAFGFLSAVADRAGLWPAEVSGWGNWENFLTATSSMNPWFPESIIPIIAVLVTGAELLFGVAILIGFKTEIFAKFSGLLILMFALSITFSSNIKWALDYSVYTASAAAFCLSLMKKKFWELDVYLQARDQ